MSAQGLSSELKEQVVFEVAGEGAGLSRRWRGPTWFLGAVGGLGQEMVEGTIRSPWMLRSVRSGRRGAGGCVPGCERPGAGRRAPGQKRFPSCVLNGSGVLVWISGLGMVLHRR